MAALFGSGNKGNKQPNYTGIQIQTSAEGLAIPVVWGQTRIAPNLLWMDNFGVHKGGGKKGGGKGGGGKGGRQSSYSAAVILGLCEGPIAQILSVYVDRTQETMADVNLVLYPGSADQAPFPAVASPGHVPPGYPYTAYVASNNYDLGSSAALPSHGFEVCGLRYGSMAGAIPDCPDVDPTLVMYDLLTSTQYGLGFDPAQIGDMSRLSAQCRALGILFSVALEQPEQATSILQRWAQVTHSWIFWSGNQFKFVPLLDVAYSGNGASYTPALTPVYALSYEDLIGDGTTPPVTVTRSDPTSGYNWLKVEVLDRGNLYATATIEYKNQASIDLYGLLQPQDIQAREINDRARGQIVANVLGQRAVNIRNSYAFKLGWNFCLLEPGDLVTLSDPNLGLDALAVRITEIAEDAAGVLSVLAEEAPAGIGTPMLTTPPPWVGVSPPAYRVDPGDVNPPAIIEPPASATANQPQVWIGLSGASPYWGGAQVWASVDDVTYIELGSIDSPIPQGVLRSALPLHGDPDSADTLAVDFTQSRQTLSSAVTSADADAGRTLALIGAELIGYGSAVPNGAGAFDYDLSALRRGFYATPIGLHAPGTPVAVLVAANMLQYNLPQAYVGQTIYLKFPSYNLFGAGLQDISAVTRYSYTPQGVAYSIAPPTSAALSNTTASSGASAIALTLTWAASPGPALGGYEVQFSADAGSTWTAVDVATGAAATQYTLSPVIPSTRYQARVCALSSNGLARSAWATSATLDSGSMPLIGTARTQLALTNGDIAPTGIMSDATGSIVYVEQ